jgi:uncharacterized protein (DUF362 family)
MDFIKKLSNKMKTSLVVFLIALTGGAAFLYQKFFGGKVENLPSDKFVVGPSEKQLSVTETKQENIAAVVYAKTPALGVQKVIAQTGNLDFILPGQKVLVKPNVNSDDPAPGTTHPEALAEVVRLAKAKGAWVVVGDRSNPRWQTIAAMKKTGIYEAARQAGADEIVGFENEDWVRVKPEIAKNWPKGFRIPKRLAQFDHIISVPVLHTHQITSHSLALKNLVGLIHPADRMIFHASSKTEEMIAEISLAIRPSLTVIEGTKAFIDGGPSHGTLATPKVYLASKDILAADVIGAELLKKHNAKLFWKSAWESPQIKHAASLNLSRYSKEEITKETERLVQI